MLVHWNFKNRLVVFSHAIWCFNSATKLAINILLTADIAIISTYCLIQCAAVKILFILTIDPPQTSFSENFTKIVQVFWFIQIDINKQDIGGIVPLILTMSVRLWNYLSNLPWDLLYTCIRSINNSKLTIFVNIFIP